MIKAHLTSKAYQDKINRHSSQLAIRKPSANSQTPRDSEADLKNIRQTTFWMKKTLGVSGLENMIPNNKKMGQSKGRNVFSMKINTDNSETDSVSNKFIDEKDKQNNIRPHSRLTLLQKSQKQLKEEINLVINQNLPKLSACQQLFTSLNKTIKLAYKSCSKTLGTQLEKMIDQHLQLSSLLFLKVIQHSNDFINTQKSNNLIAKTIELEKENSRLIEKIIKLEKNSVAEVQPPKDNVAQTFMLTKINPERILTNLYKIGQNVQLTSSKINYLCTNILKDVMNYRNTQISQYQAMLSVMEKVTGSKEGLQILRIFLNQNKKSKQVLFEQEAKMQYASLGKDTLFSLLSSKIDFKILSVVKKKVHKFVSVCKGKSNLNQLAIKQLLCLTNKFNILKDKLRCRQITIELLKKMQAVNGITLSTADLDNISNFIDESNFEYLTAKPWPSMKMNRLSNKRLVNCMNINQKKSKKNLTSQIQENAKTQTNNLNLNSYFDIDEAVLVCYWLISKQLDHLYQSCKIVSQITENSDKTQQQIYNSLLQKALKPQIYEFVKSKDSKNKEKLFQYSQILLKAYGENCQKQIIKNETFNELTAIVNNQILQMVGADEKRLILSQLVSFYDNGVQQVF